MTFPTLGWENRILSILVLGPKFVVYVSEFLFLCLKATVMGHTEILLVSTLLTKVSLVNISLRFSGTRGYTTYEPYEVSKHGFEAQFFAGNACSQALLVT